VNGLVAGRAMTIAPEGFDSVHQRQTRIPSQPVWRVSTVVEEVV
jgi:hypothetical protein